MNFSPAYLKRGLLLAVAFGVAVLSASAQRVGLWRGQPILFSSPESNDVATTLSSLSPKPPDFESTLQAPSSFNLNSPPVPEPVLPRAPAVSPAEMLRLQDLLDRRKNWTLLTPAEILGATTMEQILGIPERDANGQRKRTTALERYTERQNQTSPASTNAFPAWNFSGDRSDRLNSINGGLGSPDDMANPLLHPAPDNPTYAGQNGNNGWLKLSGSPSPSPVPNPAQPTDMDRFRQLLKTGSSSAAAAATPSLNSIKISLPQTSLGSGLPSQPAITPVGASFTPLNNGIGKPAGMPTLPSVWGLSYTSPPPAAAWMPQPAPWLSPTPQPFTVPQRKF